MPHGWKSIGWTVGMIAAEATTRGLLNVAVSNILLSSISNAITQPPLHQFIHQMIVHQTDADREMALDVVIGWRNLQPSNFSLHLKIVIILQTSPIPLSSCEIQMG